MRNEHSANRALAAALASSLAKPTWAQPVTRKPRQQSRQHSNKPRACVLCRLLANLF